MSSLNPDSFGKVRVLVAGNSGAGKTSLSELIVSGKPQERPKCTAGCSVHVKLVDYPEPSGSRQRYFVELLDVGAHSRYEALRKSFYQQLNGVILVHDVNSGGKAAALDRWAMEIAEHGTFAAAMPHELASSNLGGLPVPVLILYNKADKLRKSSALSLPERVVAKVQEAFRQIADRGLSRIGSGSSSRGWSCGSLSDAADNSISGIHTSATEGSLDREAVDAFFAQLIERRYYGGGSRAGSSSLPSYGGFQKAASGLGGAVGGGYGHQQQRLEICVQGASSELEGRLDYDIDAAANLAHAAARLDWVTTTGPPGRSSSGGLGTRTFFK